MRGFLFLCAVAFTLQGCLVTAEPTVAQLLNPTAVRSAKADAASAQVEPLKVGALPNCEAIFSSNQDTWTQCLGTAIFNGWTYTGPWINGAPNYDGRFVHSDGTTYVGQAKNGRFHGKGKITYRDGISYDGDWYIGNKKGQGILVYAEGYGTYEGQVDFDGKKHGRGTRITPDGTRVTGQWAEDKPIGTAQVVFADGSQWEGSHQNLWSKRKAAGKASTKEGEVTQAEIQQVGKCPNCIQFKASFTSPTNCKRFDDTDRKPSHTASGLPEQVGPFAVGMSFGHFECVVDTKFKDMTNSDGLEQGINLLFGAPSTFTRGLSGGDMRIATGWVSSRDEDIKKLFEMPLLPTVQAFFWNDRLYMISLDGPSVPLHVLREKYGNPKTSAVNETERCMQRNGAVADIQLRGSRWSWRDSNILIRYSKVESLDRDMFKGGLPACEKIITKTKYMVLDLKTEALVASAGERSNSQQLNRDLKKFDSF
jgi:hypothetical protein